MPRATAVLEERLFSDRELAERYGLAPATLRNWRSRGQGPRWIRIGGQVRYPSSEVATWEANRERLQQIGGSR